MGLIDYAHPAAAELRDDAVGSELRTGLQGHTERAILPLGSWGFQNRIGGESGDVPVAVEIGSGGSSLVVLYDR